MAPAAAHAAPYPAEPPASSVSRGAVSDGGTVTYTLPSLMPWLLPLQGLVLLIAGVLAAPAIRRPEVRDPAKTARRAATLSELA